MQQCTHSVVLLWLESFIKLTGVPVCCSFTAVQIAAAVSELRERGFINYFGLQRFGTGNVPTHRFVRLSYCSTT
jgi:hypothetical protein